MAKKNFGKLFAFAAIAGAAVGAVTYCLRYKSFHKELDEDFHDFEDEFESFDDEMEKSSASARNYVSLNGDRQNDAAEPDSEASSLQEKSEETGTPEQTVEKDTAVESSGSGSDILEKSAAAAETSGTTTIVEDTTE